MKKIKSQNYFDKEMNIIEYIQDLSFFDINFSYSSIKLNYYFFTIWSKKKFNKWIDNSKDSVNPPDFYSDYYKVMLEVMRVDDYELNSNSPNALENKMVYELEKKRIENNMLTFSELGTKLFIIPDMRKVSNNDYKTYFNNFSRIVRKHINKINVYKTNNQKHKLCFLIFDESTGYIEPYSLEEYNNVQPYQAITVRLHQFWRDKNLIDVFINEDIDYVLWCTPFKNIAEIGKINPYLTLIDVRKYKKKYYKYVIEYSEETLRTQEKF